MASARRSANSAMLLLLALALLCWHSVLHMFVGAAKPLGRVVSRTEMQVNILDGIQFPSLKKEKDPIWDQNRAGLTAADVEGRVVDVQLPLGVEFREDAERNIFVQEVDENSDAWVQGVRPGAQLVQISSTFGDEMWETRNCGLVQLSAVIQSRYGGSIKMALIKEQKDVVEQWKAFFAPQTVELDEKKEQIMLNEFEKEEAKLAQKQFWNPFAVEG